MEEARLIIQSSPQTIKSIIIEKNRIIITMEEMLILKILNIFKKNSLLNYNTLLDTWAVDKYFRPNNRYELFNVILSKKTLKRLFIKRFPLIMAKIPKAVSLSTIFSSANFLEREVWDLFGIFFVKHVDLRRILTDYGFKGFPLRKDFPVAGFLEVFYDDPTSKLVYKPVKFTQAYRLFNFNSPWRPRKF